MDPLFRQNFKKIHFIGIGGVSMSGLAKLARGFGYEVSGSDSGESAEIAKLRDLGIPVFPVHAEENVREADAVVFSSAIGADNPELQRAILSGKCVLSRGKFLGMISAQFGRVIAFSGAHGKTTATALLAEILKNENAAFCYHLGGVLKSVGENTACFGKDCFVCEACEYKRNFLSLRPDVGVILNVDFDHPDYYRDIEDVRAAYRSFAKQCRCTVGHCSVGFCDVSFGIEGTDFRAGSDPEPDLAAYGLARTEEGFRFELRCGGKKYEAVSPFLFRHNVENVLAVLAVCREFGIDLVRAIGHVAAFGGVERRFERLEAEGIPIYSDYAHHPKQIEGVIRALKEEGHRVLCVFEPHTYSRTVRLFCEFSEALSLADEVFLLPVFAAREAEVKGVAEALCEEVARKTPCRLIDYEQVLPILKGREGTAVALGAGGFDGWLRRKIGGE